MRKIYYLTGLTAMGKTTTAQKLAELLGIEFLSVDPSYQYIGKKHKHPSPQELCHPDRYNSALPNMREDKLEFWKERLKDRKGDIIFEGFTLFFEDERSIIKEAIGEPVHEVMLLIKLPYLKWCEFHYKKYNRKPQAITYELHYKKYFQKPSAPVYECHTIEEVLPKIVDYQRDGFTNVKWKLLKMNPEELKDKVILDIGCNDGWIGKYCLDAGAKRVFGIDKNWRYLEGARSRGTKVFKMQLDDTEFAKFMSDTKFDIVFCLATFHYIKDKQGFLLEIKKKTRKLFVLEMPVHKTDKILLDKPKHYNYLIPSESLLKLWLEEVPFSKVERVGESIPPDKSYRVIYKCYV